MEVVLGRGDINTGVQGGHLWRLAALDEWLCSAVDVILRQESLPSIAPRQVTLGRGETNMSTHGG